MKHTMLIVLAATAGWVGGCGTTLDLPDGFVRVDQGAYGQYNLRGISPDGMVLAVRCEDNAENGTTAFWGQAITRELAGRNYAPGKTEDVKSSQGLGGALLTFTTERGGRSYTYMTAIFVKDALIGDGNVLIAEAAGESADVTACLDKIRTALLSVR